MGMKIVLLEIRGILTQWVRKSAVRMGIVVQTARRTAAQTVGKIGIQAVMWIGAQASRGGMTDGNDGF